MTRMLNNFRPDVVPRGQLEQRRDGQRVVGGHSQRRHQRERALQVLQLRGARGARGATGRRRRTQSTRAADSWVF